MPIGAQEYALACALLVENRRLEERIKELEKLLKEWQDLCFPLKQKLQQQEDYIEMLMHWMQRTDTDRAKYESPPVPLKVWGQFLDDYPSDAAALEKWLEERHAD